MEFMAEGYRFDSSQLRTRRIEYETAQPFPHLIIDNFLPDSLAQRAAAEFPTASPEWTHYYHINERKKGNNNALKTNLFFRELIEEVFHSPPFLNLLTELTGIPNLMVDPSFEGGGFHVTEPGGFLNIHRDFSTHPYKKNWRRRVNVLLYLNSNWKAQYGGQLEFWDREMKNPVTKIEPLLNRCILFETGSKTFHGHPTPLACPPGMFDDR